MKPEDQKEYESIHHVFFMGLYLEDSPGINSLLHRLSTNQYKDFTLEPRSIWSIIPALIQTEFAKIKILCSRNPYGSCGRRAESLYKEYLNKAELFIICIRAQFFVPSNYDITLIEEVLSIYGISERPNSKIIFAITQTDRLTELAIITINQNLKKCIATLNMAQISSYVLVSAKTGFGFDSLKFNICRELIKRKIFEDAQRMQDLFMEQYIVRRFIDHPKDKQMTKLCNQNKLKNLKQIKRFSEPGNMTFNLLKKIECEILPFTSLQLWLSCFPGLLNIFSKFFLQFPEPIVELILEYTCNKEEDKELLSIGLKLPSQVVLLAANLSREIFFSDSKKVFSQDLMDSLFFNPFCKP